jgi:hypothetical protein
MAQKLMLQHNLTMDDVEEIESDKKIPLNIRKEAYKKPVTNYMNLPWWYGSLAMIISENFRCFCFKQTDWRNGKGKRLVFLGLKEDAQIANDVFHFAVKCIEHLSKGYLNDNLVSTKKMTRTKNDYIFGYLDSLTELFKKQVEDSFQLALVKDEIVVSEYDKIKLKDARKTKIGIAGDNDAYETGFEDGKNFNYGAKALK